MTNFPAIVLTPDAQGRPTCLSTDVARHFQKKHLHVLRDIDRLRSICPASFFESNFGFKEIDTQVGFGIRKDRAYRLTRDAFSLLVMGFTGSAAIRWKLRYIEAFNALEAAAKANHDMAARIEAAGHLAGQERVSLAVSALELLSLGLTQAEAGRRLEVSRHVIYRLKKRFAFLMPGLKGVEA